MSNALAIAGVTAVLKDLLDNGLIDRGITTTIGHAVTVSALAPDLIQLGSDAAPRLNLFMHQATPNAAWRNVGYPTRDYAGQPINNAPLALDLHYLLTAYGNAELQSELLLGYAMQLLHETPVLARGAIRTALNPLPAPTPVNSGLLPAIYQALQASDLADQVEQIKITPSVMNTEELSKLWTAIQSHYRPTAAYQVTVVLIESSAAVRSPLPVLTRGPVDPATHRERGIVVLAGLVPPFPEIESIKLPNSQISALLDDIVEFEGHDLDGSGHTLLLSSQRLGIESEITPAATATASSVRFALASASVSLSAGSYTAALRLTRAGESAPRLTNQLTLSIAPQITLPATVHPDTHGYLKLTPTCKPDVRPNQRVSLIFGENEILADPFSAATSSPTFQFKAPAPDFYWARLRVDGVDSPLINRSTTPPKFIAPRIKVGP